MVGGGMAFEIGHDDLVGDVSGCGRKVIPRPEALPPVALAHVLEFLLDSARGTPLGSLDELADRDMRRNVDEQVDVVSRQSSTDDGHPHLSADLVDDVTHPDPNIADEHLVPILGCPDEMMAVMKERVTAVTVRHSWFPLGSETSRPAGGLTSQRIPAIDRVQG